jgi:hypothetical protein
METKTLKLTFRIFLLGLTAMVASYLPELFPNFFGDWLCEGSGNYLDNLHHFERCNYTTNTGRFGFHHPEWHWGYRHYVCVVTCFVLLIVQIKDITEN